MHEDETKRALLALLEMLRNAKTVDDINIAAGSLRNLLLGVDDD